MPRRSVHAVVAAPALALTAALCLGACGNNGVAEQSREHSVVTGASGQVGQVQIRNATITLGLDGAGLLAVAFFNGGDPDTLTGISSPQAAGFTLPTTSGTVNAYGNPSDNPENDASPAAAKAATGVALPSQTGVFLGQGLDYVTISGLTGTPLVGDSIPTTFTFGAAGSVTLQVPITGAPQAGDAASPTPTGTGTNGAGTDPGSDAPTP